MPKTPNNLLHLTRILAGEQNVSQIVHHISLGADMWIANQAPLEDCMDKKKCANCGKEIDLDDKSSFTTIMHHQMHRYVCDNNKCIHEFYGYKPRSNGVANNVINPTAPE